MSSILRETEEYISTGDIVAVRHGLKGVQEGLVTGSYFDYAGRQVVTVLLDGNIIHSPVTRVRRVIYNSLPSPNRVHHIERRVYW